MGLDVHSADYRCAMERERERERFECQIDFFQLIVVITTCR